MIKTALTGDDDMKKHIEAMQKAGLSLALFAFISVIFVSLTNQLTASRIEQNHRMMLLQALNEVIEPGSYDNDLTLATLHLKPEDLGFQRDTTVYLATRGGEPVGALFQVTTLEGYSGAITLLIGISAKEQKITGVRVLEHSETPGLGDKVELRKSRWVLSFDGKSLNQPELRDWAVKKDGGQFDQFTGATITPRAVVNAVKTTLLYAQKHMNALFEHYRQQTAAVKGNPS